MFIVVLEFRVPSGADPQVHTVRALQAECQSWLESLGAEVRRVAVARGTLSHRTPARRGGLRPTGQGDA